MKTSILNSTVAESLFTKTGVLLISAVIIGGCNSPATVSDKRSNKASLDAAFIKNVCDTINIEEFSAALGYTTKIKSDEHSQMAKFPAAHPLKGSFQGHCLIAKNSGAINEIEVTIRNLTDGNLGAYDRGDGKVFRIDGKSYKALYHVSRNKDKKVIGTTLQVKISENEELEIGELYSPREKPNVAPVEALYLKLSQSIIRKYLVLRKN